MRFCQHSAVTAHGPGRPVCLFEHMYALMILPFLLVSCFCYYPSILRLFPICQTLYTMAFVNGLLQGRQAHQPELPPGFDPMAGVQENRQLILGVSIFSIILATAPVIGRLSSRKGSKLPWKADDYLIIIATVSSRRKVNRMLDS